MFKKAAFIHDSKLISQREPRATYVRWIFDDQAQRWGVDRTGTESIKVLFSCQSWDLAGFVNDS
jgi:hypothetical protein